MRVNTISAAYDNETAAVTQQKQTFCGDVEYAAVMMDELASRIGRLADRLCGTLPTADVSTNAKDSDGLFGAVSDLARAIQYRISDANECLDRIERALP